MRISARSIVYAAAGLILGGSSSLSAEPPVVREYLDAYCIGCHGPDSRKGNLRLDDLVFDPADPKSFATWVKVHERVAAGEMPPRTKPPVDETRGFLGASADALAAADRVRAAARGRTTIRRLTRTEYENTLRDLLDLPGLRVKDQLPEDGRAEGFDKVAEALEFSSVLLAKYMEAADFALDHAIARRPAAPEVFRYRSRLFWDSISPFNDAMVPLEDKKADREHVKYVKDHYEEREKLVADDDGFGILTSPRPAFQPELLFTPIADGVYRLRLSLWAFHWKAAEVLPSKRNESVSLTANGRLLKYFDAPPDVSQVGEVTCWLNAGEKIELAAASLWPHFGDPLTYEGPGVGFDWYEVEGPIHDAWPPRSHRRLFGDLPIVKVPPPGEGETPRPAPRRRDLYTYQDGTVPRPADDPTVWTVASADPEADAARLLADFLPRAFRRPVGRGEVERYARLAIGRLEAGACFEEAMRAAYRVALCSPEFLYLRERPGPLDDHALAARLSYFLCCSMPDDVLRAAADSGKLRDPAELARQAGRLMADPKSDRFVNDFLDQWLDLREINATTPDAQLYPEFRPNLRDAMLAESRAFFRELLDRDLGAARLADADFAMLNQRLAEHYGVPGVVGGAVRRVPLPAEAHRGGLLTQAAVLKVTANGTTTSPVKRGAWVMDKLLGRRPAPPPPDIPAVDPDIRGTVTIREQLARHRAAASCAACHAKFDPPGFALESFDVIGGWRTRYRSSGEQGERPDLARFFGAPNLDFLPFRHGPPVDPSGVLRTGEAFADIDEFKRLLLRDPEAIADNLARRLLVYATGAPVGFADRQAVRELVSRSRERDYGVRTLLLAAIASPTFRNK